MNMMTKIGYYLAAAILILIIGWTTYAWWPWPLILIGLVVLVAGTVFTRAKISSRPKTEHGTHTHGTDHHDAKHEDHKDEHHDDHGHHGPPPGEIKESTYQAIEFASRLILVIGLVAVAWVIMNGAEKVAKVAKQASPPRLYVVNPAVMRSPLPPAAFGEYPAAGEEVTTKAGIKCWLDPERSSTRLSVPAVYVFADNADIRFVDPNDGISKNSNINKWYKMPAGKYIVYPQKEGDVLRFRWWMD